MRKLLLLIVLIGFTKVYSQDQVGIFFSQNYSTFRFIDSDNNKEDLDYTIGFGYGILYQKALRDHLYIRTDLFYNKLGATQQIDIDKLDWDLHYAGLDAAFGYTFSFGRIKPFGNIGLYYSYLLKADQSIGTQYFDLLKEEVLNTSDFGLKVSIGTAFQYSDNGSVFISLNEDWGFKELEKSNDTQNMYNRNFSIQLGLHFSIVE